MNAFERGQSGALVAEVRRLVDEGVAEVAGIEYIRPEAGLHAGQ